MLVNGWKSCSGKVVFQPCDTLVKIYGGTASSEAIFAGVDTDRFNCVDQNVVNLKDKILDEDSSLVSLSINENLKMLVWNW